jgi:hypothetical protein
MPERSSIFQGMNRLDTGRQAAILRSLVEGNSIRATARICGVNKDSVTALLRIVGAHCKNYHDRYVTNVKAKRVQCDEIWAFVFKKERRATDEDKAEGKGDAWTFTALDADTKLTLAYRVALRDMENTKAFIHDVCDRIEGRTQLTTDGFLPYLYAVEKAFGWARVRLAQLVKKYGPSPEPAGKYSPATCVAADKRPRSWGSPKPPTSQRPTWSEAISRCGCRCGGLRASRTGSRRRPSTTCTRWRSTSCTTTTAARTRPLHERPGSPRPPPWPPDWPYLVWGVEDILAMLQ